MVSLEFFVDVILSAPLSIGAPVGEPGEASFAGNLREKKCVSGSLFSSTQRTLKVKSGGHLEL